MSEYKIKKGVKMPVSRRGGPLKYPWPSMKVGDSFFCNSKRQVVISRAAILYGKRHNMKFATRKEKDGVRVWRIK